MWSFSYDAEANKPFFPKDPAKALQQKNGNHLNNKNSWSPLAYGFGLDKNLIVLLQELRPEESSRVGCEYQGTPLLIDDWDRTANLFMPRSWLESSPMDCMDEMSSFQATADSERNADYLGKREFLLSHEILSLIILFYVVM